MELPASLKAPDPAEFVEWVKSKCRDGGTLEIMQLRQRSRR